MFDQINKYKASFGRLFEAKTLKVMLEIALLTILLSFLGPIKNMIYTEVVNKLSLGITVKLGIIMFASYIVVQVIEECVSYFQIYLNTVLQLKLGQSVSHEINNKWCCTIKVDIENSKGQYIEKDKQEATKDGSESTKIQHGI